MPRHDFNNLLTSIVGRYRRRRTTHLKICTPLGQTAGVMPPKQPPKRKPDVEPELPPLVPTTRADLDQAAMLLGEAVKAELRSSRRDKLAALVGEYPRDAATAARWKAALKAVRNDEIFGEP